MYTDYNDFRFLYPPRPEIAIPPAQIKYYQDHGWVANYKLNGTCSEIAIGPDGSMHTMTRHGTKHKAWSPETSQTRRLSNYVRKGNWTVFVAELMHSKTPTIKDTLYIFDIIVHDSKELIGTTYMDRQELLSYLFNDPQSDDADSHYVIENGLWLAKTHMYDLKRKFDEIREHPTKAIEGLVLKNPAGKLGFMDKDAQNQSWQVKCRIPNFCYMF